MHFQDFARFISKLEIILLNILLTNAGRHEHQACSSYGQVASMSQLEYDIAVVAKFLKDNLS